METSNFSGGIYLRHRMVMNERGKTALKDYTEAFFGNNKVLSKEERDELIVKYTPLIRYVAEKLSSRLPAHISYDDLVSVGAIGLMDALQKFDPLKGIKFKTYAEFRIRGSMLDELRSLDWIPRSIRKKTSEIEQTYQNLEKELGRPAEDDEMAKALGVDLSEFYDLLERTKGVTFLDIELIRRRLPSNNEDDLFDLIADDNATDPFEQLRLTDIKYLVIEAIEGLPEKEQLVLSLYYYNDLTMKEIGEIMGYTESRISQMHTKAILRIRARIESEMGCIWDDMM